MSNSLEILKELQGKARRAISGETVVEIDTMDMTFWENKVEEERPEIKMTLTHAEAEELRDFLNDWLKDTGR